MVNFERSRIVRISSELDKQIKDIMSKNNTKYIDASKDIAKLAAKFNGKSVFKEIKF